MTEATAEATTPNVEEPGNTEAHEQGNPAEDALGDAGKKALDAMKVARNEATRRAAELEARLKEFEDRDKTEAERIAERAQAAEKRAAEAEARAARLDVAFEKGLTPAQAKRLVGATREELEADADEILRDFPTKPGRPSGDIEQGARTPAPITDPRARDIAQIEADLRAGKSR